MPKLVENGAKTSSSTLCKGRKTVPISLVSHPAENFKASSLFSSLCVLDTIAVLYPKLKLNTCSVFSSAVYVLDLSCEYKHGSISLIFPIQQFQTSVEKKFNFPS